MRVHHVVRFFSAAALAGAVVACDQAPIEWKDPAELARTDTLGRLTVDSNGHASVVAAASPPAAISASNVVVCPGSVRSVRGTVHVFAAWWGMRADSAATLFVSSATPTGNWAEAKRLAVDTTDMSKAGCDRPAPSVTTVGDDVFVAYSLHAPEGRGVFFAHTMGGMVHEPVPVVYGERVVTTAIAAQDQRVVVAYEEANGTRRRINVAISEDQGHTFGWHVPASRDVDIGRDPDVALAGDHVAVSWMAAGGADSANSRVVRVGRLK
ncbi:MAG TPA: hypothetical protein VGQ44_23170 [Gemmatimonadaceae bacterium]|nr:hypothetical protein [Gemmatimonadaceae bacterium]